jgi:hypothetical protein
MVLLLSSNLWISWSNFRVDSIEFVSSNLETFLLNVIHCHVLGASFGHILILWQAKEAGSTRFCMGAAWRETVGRKTNFNQILEYVKEIR